MTGKAKGRLWIILASLVALVAISAPATAAAKDRNRDRIPDRWERSFGLSLKVDQRKLDQDSDGLRNRGEWMAGMSPRDRDTDDDGVTDLREKAGVISAWDPEAMTLEITLYAGGTISGTVSEYTMVKCPPAEEPEAPVDEGETPEPQTLHFGGRPGFGAGGPMGERPGRFDRGPHRHWPRPPKKDCGANCSLEDLAVGVEVLQADVRYTSEGAVFARLKIDVPAPAPDPEPDPDPVG